MTAPKHLSREVYARAERLLERNIAKLVFNATLEPHWLPDGSFWYHRESREGASVIRVDAATGRKTEVSDPEALTRAHEAPPPEALRSPDGRWELLRSGYDIALRKVAGGETRRLTADGTADRPYAASPDTNLQAVTQRIQGLATPPVAAWSPDGRQFVTHRLDQSGVGLLPLVQSCPADGSTRPVVHHLHMPLPGDATIGRSELLILEVATGRILPIGADPLPVPFLSPLELGWVWWSEDSARVYFLREGRGSKTLELCAADAATGTVRSIFAESSDSYVEPSPLLPWLSQVRSLGETGEIIWPSERDGWRHLYLLDEASGQIKRKLTEGPWVVREVIDVDAEARFVYFTASGRETGHDPYLRQLYRVSLDGSAPERLTEAEADHRIRMAPDRSCFVTTWSRVDLAPVSELRAADGRLIAQLEKADLADFFAEGFAFPERFTVKAADGTTDLHGVLYKPSNFDPAHRYPVIDDLYPGPQLIRTPKSFCLNPSAAFETWPGRWASQSLAELGFIVINLDGRGTPLRSRAFHLASYGRLEDAGCLEDHLAALDQLAGERPYLDLGRLGAVGHSAGGYAATRALLPYPERYKVAVASSPDQDLLCYLGYWAEKYQGLPIDERYLRQANSGLAQALRGKLLLIHGELDDNVNPYATLRFVDALIHADKDFDLLIVPGANHDLMNHPYVIRRKWDYFVTHLMGAVPLTER
ncbi:MAG TPA: DPP IV N-terminal domain-containing protein [Dongiaceae bacterium]|nr:DPP IV N-terminal domain-containing protein [Dongiaceae bacterium]